MKSFDFLKLATRLEREAKNLKFGTVQVAVQVHAGKVCKIRFTKQDCIALQLNDEENS